jgi:hypothetical protein
MDKTWTIATFHHQKKPLGWPNRRRGGEMGPRNILAHIIALRHSSSSKGKEEIISKKKHAFTNVVIINTPHYSLHCES